MSTLEIGGALGLVRIEIGGAYHIALYPPRGEISIRGGTLQTPDTYSYQGNRLGTSPTPCNVRGRFCAYGPWVIWRCAKMEMGDFYSDTSMVF